MITNSFQHAAVIASAIADAICTGAERHPARRDLEYVAELLDTAVIAFDEAEPAGESADAASAPADAVLALQDAEVLAARFPGTALPLGFTAVIFAPITGRAPELPAPIGAASHQLAQQAAQLRARLALVEEWLLDTQHPDMVPAYASMSFTLRSKLAHIAAAVAVGSRD
ncbi:hypothetical protein ACWCQZ_40660 [Streptomyces sp. NPDC002285]